MMPIEPGALGHFASSEQCRGDNTRFAEVLLFPRGCHVATTWRHVVTTWQPRGEHVVTTWQPRGNNCTSANRVCASPQIPDMHMCTSANPRCACVHVRKSCMGKSANPRCACVHVRKSSMCTSANRVCARHDSRDLPGHRTGGRGSLLLLDKSETLQLVMLLPADVTPSQRALHVV